MGVGRATRLLRFLGELPKTYEATMRLGVETTTLDADGEVVRSAPVAVDDDRLAEVVGALVGESMQRPPAYSAVKVGGRKLYEAARKGEVLEAPPRPITVDRFDGARSSPRRRRRGDHLRRRHVRPGARGRRGDGARVWGSPHGAATDRDRRRSRSPSRPTRTTRDHRSRSSGPSPICLPCGSTPRKPSPQGTAACSRPQGSTVRTRSSPPTGGWSGSSRTTVPGRSRSSCWQPTERRPDPAGHLTPDRRRASRSPWRRGQAADHDGGREGDPLQIPGLDRDRLDAAGRAPGTDP